MVQIVQAWNLDILQLDRGRARGDIHQLDTGSALVTRQVSERTLEYAFRDHFGMTPVSCLKSIRLNGVLPSRTLERKRVSRVAVRP